MKPLEELIRGIADLLLEGNSLTQLAVEELRVGRQVEHRKLEDATRTLDGLTKRVENALAALAKRVDELEKASLESIEALWEQLNQVPTREQLRVFFDGLAKEKAVREKSAQAWMSLAGAIEAWVPEVAARLAATQTAAEGAQDAAEDAGETAETVGKETKDASAALVEAAKRAEDASKSIQTQTADAKLPAWLQFAKLFTNFLTNFIKAEREKMLMTILLVVVVGVIAACIAYFWVHPALNSRVDEPTPSTSTRTKKLPAPAAPAPAK